MCRFLIVKSKDKLNTETYLKEFAALCKQSVAPNGDLQEDGWGAAWFDEKLGWQTVKSLAPIWKDKETFSTLPKTKMLVAHARSATHAKEKGKVSFNQPFIDGDYCFVFNGALRGVSIKKPVPGEIGSQKIWALLKELLATNSPPVALKKLNTYLTENSKEINALNIGVITKESVAVLCKYGNEKEYYTVHYQEGDITIVCSEKYNTTKKMANDQILYIK